MFFRRKARPEAEWDRLGSLAEREYGRWRFHRCRAVQKDSEGRWWQEKAISRWVLWVYPFCWRWKKRVPTNFSCEELRIWDVLERPNTVMDVRQATGMQPERLTGVLNRWLAFGWVWVEWIPEDRRAG